MSAIFFLILYDLRKLFSFLFHIQVNHNFEDKSDRVSFLLMLISNLPWAFKNPGVMKLDREIVILDIRFSACVIPYLDEGSELF